MSFAGIVNRGFANVSDVTVFDIADAARAALKDFLTGTSNGWSPEDLQSWLSGPYARAISHVGRHTTISVVCRTGGDLVSEIVRTRERIVELAKRGLAARDCCTAHRALETRSVVAVQDHYGSVGYAPAGRHEASLFDRVASLLLSDMLTRPRDYEAWECEECGDVAGGWLHEGMKQATTLLESGVVERAEREPNASSSRPALRPSADPTLTECVKVRVG